MPVKRELTGANTDLEQAVQDWANEEAEEYPDTGVAGVLADLFHGGCQSGMVGSLVYYSDTIPFYQEHKEDINVLLCAALQDSGCKSPSELFRPDAWDADDPLAMDTSNQNLLAWFGFEEAARALACRNGVEC